MPVITIKNNKTCSITFSDIEDAEESQKILAQLRRHLSFKAEGVEYTQAYKNGWNGITYMVDKRGSFPLGLITRVEDFFLSKSVKYSVEDKRIPFEFDKPIDISKRLKDLGRAPRDYQLEILEATKKYDRGIVRATCGAGKTLAISLCAAEHTCNIIVFVIGLSLLDQFHETLTSIFDEKIGYVGNSVCDVQRITVCSVWTAGKALDLKDVNITDLDEDFKETFNTNNKVSIIEMLKKAKLVFWDECHSVNCSSIQNIFKVLDPQKCFGFSATPYRDDGSELLAHGYLGEQVVNITASRLIERGFLKKPIIKFVNVPAESIQGSNYAQIYSEYVVENETRNLIVVKETKKLIDKNYKVMVAFKNIKHGKILAKLFEKENIRFEMISGKDKLDIRLEAKRKIENDEIDVILGSKVLSIGVDLPILSGLVMAGGGKSSIFVSQLLGRCCRGYPGRDIAAVVDFYDNVRYLKKHSQIRHKLYCSEPGFEVMENKNFK